MHDTINGNRVAGSPSQPTRAAARIRRVLGSAEPRFAFAFNGPLVGTADPDGVARCLSAANGSGVIGDHAAGSGSTTRGDPGQDPDQGQSGIRHC